MTITRKPIDADVADKRARDATDPNGPTGRLATWLVQLLEPGHPCVTMSGNAFSCFERTWMK
jgi:hypothetical protein